MVEEDVPVASMLLHLDAYDCVGPELQRLLAGQQPQLFDLILPDIAADLL